MVGALPISVIISTFEEEKNIARCLEPLSVFDEVIIVDSNSSDYTVDIAKKYNVRIVNFTWNGKYPKKRQWILDNVKTRNNIIFFLDADEIVTNGLVDELSKMKEYSHGYFVKGLYEMNGKILKFGLSNSKLALFDKRYFRFPVIDDLDIEAMGEIEGHYQPVPINDNVTIGKLKGYVIHRAFEDEKKWKERHERYAIWERGMNRKNAWPEDPVLYRRYLKKIFRNIPFRYVFVFLYSYFFRLGFLDGCEGFDFAVKKMYYYHAIR